MPFDVYDTQEEAAGSARGGARPFIGVHFECCGVYARIYRRPEERSYEGRCPRCLAQVRVRVGRDGVATRMFRAS